MSKRAQLADGTILEFPDETPDAVVDKTVKQHLSATTTGPDGKPVQVDVPPGSDDAAVRAAVAKSTGDQRYLQSRVNRPALADDLATSAKAVTGNMGEAAVAIPDVLAKGGGVITNAIGSGITTVGDAFLRAGGAGQKTLDTFGDFMAPAPTRTLGEMFSENTPQATPGVGLASQFLGGALVPFPGLKGVPKMAIPAAPVESAAQKVIQAGDDAGVRVMTSDVSPPKTFLSKAAQRLGENIPFAGTGGNRAAQQAERQAAVEGLARDHGVAADSEHLTPVMDDLVKRRGDLLSRFTKQKTQVIDNTPGAVSTPNVTAAIDAAIAQQSGIGTAASKQIVSKLQDWRAAIQGKDLPTIEAIRKEMGDAFKSPELSSVRSAGEKALSGIYGPLRDDMGNFIAANGEDGARASWEGANKQLASMAGELKNGVMRRTLNAGNETPEAVASMLFSAKPSDVKRLYGSLSSDGQAAARSAIVQRAVEKAGGVGSVSPDKFANEIQRLGKSVGVFFKGDDLARIKGLEILIGSTKRAAEASVSPPTGAQALPYAISAGFTGLFGPYVGIPAAAATGLLARAYESPVVRDLLVKAARSPKGSRSQALAIDRARTALMGAIGSGHGNLSAAFNDTAMLSAAARDKEEERQGQ
jgi:hypothetical protein